ncbi:hypothetical protein [Nitrosophilus kaiyonis]|uniref:hypothetical protein n=1 Tax=Nitrosophilus kaiyonis TaxID=2930200 RepID=UPI00248F8B36|nr:hypothetical protein [Nitrosophilus kaiyonis]
MKVPLIISYNNFEPINLYNVESFLLKDEIIVFHFSKRSIEWIFDTKDEAKTVYDIICERYVHFIENE